MFGISGEHLLVLLVILLIFGPRRLPDLGNSLGRAMKGFKDAMSGDSLDVKEPEKEELPKPILTKQAEPQEETLPPHTRTSESNQETRV